MDELISEKELRQLTKRQLGIINKIIVHCSDSDYDYHDDIKVIDKWHRERGWICVGYHFFIRNNGIIELGRPIGTIGAHCEGHNKTSIGICLSGKSKFSNIQFKQLLTLLHNLVDTFYLLSEPSYTFQLFHHRDLNPHKTCPNFDMEKDARLYKHPYKDTDTDYLISLEKWQ